MSVLVAYASKHGATRGIAEFIAETIRGNGKDAEAQSVEEASSPESFEAVVLGSAVYAGSWRNEATEYARRHREALAERPVWLFSSGPLGSEIEDAEEQPKELAELREAIHPRDHRLFFGALERDKLGFAERMIAKAVKAPEGDFRDWDEIRTWAEEIAQQLA